MDDLIKRGHRSMDGPVRQVKKRDVAADLPMAAAEPVVDELVVEPIVEPTVDATVVTPAESDEPIFVYEKSRKGQKVKKNMWNPRHWGWRRWSLMIVLVSVLSVVGWLGFVSFTSLGKIIQKSNGTAFALSGSTDVTKLKGEGDGRVNILLLGIGGGNHDGGDLSDTIMVLSLDPKTKDVAMLSIPRDLYVKINSSTYGKINGANAFGGPLLAEKVVQNVIGVPIHYYIQLDFSGFQQMVDAVGGVDINVKDYLSDPEYPCDNNQYRSCGYTQNVGQYHMDGIRALKYARCRKGTCGDDFGRAARQQEVIVALRQKAMQLSTLTNPVKIASLISAIGDHVKTDLQISEINKLALIAKDVDTTKLVNKVLNTDADNYLDFGPASLNAGSVEVPRAGLFNYTDIQDFVKNIFIDHYITDENALVQVQNGTGVTGVASTVTNSLKLAHYNVLQPSNAPTVSQKTVIYDYTNGKKPYTIKYLETRFGVKSQKATLPTVSPSASPAASGIQTPEIRIILGSDYTSTNTNR
jgi:LCP family protein required for cell wall assembly